MLGRAGGNLTLHRYVVRKGRLILIAFSNNYDYSSVILHCNMTRSNVYLAICSLVVQCYMSYHINFIVKSFRVDTLLSNSLSFFYLGVLL